MSKQREYLDGLLTWAKELADPDWCLSVPAVAKTALIQLVTVIENTKPRTITTAEELDAMPDGSVILDSVGDSAQKLSGLWYYPETAPITSHRAAKYQPLTVLNEPAQ